MALSKLEAKPVRFGPVPAIVVIYGNVQHRRLVTNGDSSATATPSK
jgi:hypothetical protein